MKVLSVAIFVTSFFYSIYAQAQDRYEVPYVPQKVGLVYGGFYISEVEDSRDNKEDIGFAQVGFFNKKVRADFALGFDLSVKRFFIESAPWQEGFTKVAVVVRKFEISEVTKFSTEFAIAEVEIDYYSDSVFLYKSTVSVETQGLDVTKKHPENIEKLLRKSLYHFDRSDWLMKLKSANSVDRVLSIEPKEESSVKQDYTYTEIPTVLTQNDGNRNTTSLGYQIGGLTLVGIDYEIRMHDYVGVHFGIGLMGYTGGLKFHTDKSKNSSFFNLSLKDAGFGLVKTAALEYGGRIPFIKSGDFGLHVQAGLAKWLYVDDVIAERLFPDGQVPEYGLSVGVGFGW